MFLFNKILCNVLGFKMMKRTIHHTMKKPFTIVVEGNIGSGKTTFINNFLNDENVLTLVEPIHEWTNLEGHNLLELLYKDTSKWAFTFQQYVQLTMTKLHEMRTSKSVKIIERSLYSARYCFVEHLYKEGIIQPPQLAVLDEWFKWIISREEMTCDLIVYLRTSPDVAYERIKMRNRSEEQCISKEFIEKLHEYHEDWLYLNRKFSCPSQVLVLDANKDIQTIQKEYKVFRNEVNF